jgi:NAD(P)-dependent dehydrogenase (short-subunit alcohol dehydrogenase family)
MAVVLVTGGSSGIGLATVRRLAAAGHQVFSGSRQPTRAALPGGVTPLPLDVADPAAASAAIRSVTAPLEETAGAEELAGLLRDFVAGLTAHR